MPSGRGMISRFIKMDNNEWLFIRLEPYNKGGTPIEGEQNHEDIFFDIIRSINSN